ncbi:MAG: RluA family pseudouridine synthase [Candidatus Omnitrophica bacterium]|nr:RluA family pseudouridine synthase [Candidatus Omnitrophota bacterium]MBU0878012.1 RluA family pseudouridine synthase [Candidatus Omnitrophota bacterium]MBU0897373.1 RluA family pseudouridine synthase [Candidatus Omnitrophota bacterium]MBU1133662.1 RluA family pseudouridine synthase [Candidatus Omnitrophota bacterium]MBU1810697.1 RluA family pseudouridine synthase [Candidatus Omnitrophota bacterium]
MSKAFEIVFNDEYLIVVNKIAKILVQPSPKKEKYTLTSLLGKETGRKVYPCHRLDRETAGLIIYAKSEAAQREIMREFKQGEVKKKYIALVKGKLSKKKGVLEGRIIDREGKIFGERPKQAKTIYRVLKEFNNFSMVELEPLTGRTNQLRIQLAKIGNPILGERKYAFRRDFAINVKRLALCAYSLSFTHPLSKERVNLEIPLPQDMETFLKIHMDRSLFFPN